MSNVLGPSVLYRGYSTPDPNNTYGTFQANTAITVTFEQPVNRLLIYGVGANPIYVKFGGEAASQANFDVVIPAGAGLSAGLNITEVSLYCDSAVPYFCGGFREQNTEV